MSNTPEGNGSNGRLPDGRWAPGNRGGPGNPHARRMHGLRAELLEATQPSHIRAITNKLIELATGGDVGAAKLILSYSLGQPVQAIEVTGGDGTPLGLDFNVIQAAILRALAGHPDARVKVAAELRTLIDVGGPGTTELGA